MFNSQATIVKAECHGQQLGCIGLVCMVVVIISIHILGPLFMCLAIVYVADFKLEYLIA